MLVKKDWVKLAILLVAGTALLGTVCFAAEPAPAPAAPEMAKPVKVQGMISVTKDANDVITKVTVTTKDKVVYNVTLDEKGKELGKLANKEAEVEGTVSEKGMQKWIKVTSSKAVEKAPEAAAPVAPKPAPKAPEAK
jgi:hypothetical protein